MDKRVRSLSKAISWRIVATSTTILLVFIFTGNPLLSVGVGSLELIVKLIVYYLHERVWNMSDFGRKESSVNLSVKATAGKHSLATSDEDDKYTQRPNRA